MSSITVVTFVWKYLSTCRMMENKYFSVQYETKNEITQLFNPSHFLIIRKRKRKTTGITQLWLLQHKNWNSVCRVVFPFQIGLSKNDLYRFEPLFEYEQTVFYLSLYNIYHFCAFLNRTVTLFIHIYSNKKRSFLLSTITFRISSNGYFSPFITSTPTILSFGRSDEQSKYEAHKRRSLFSLGLHFVA